VKRRRYNLWILAGLIILLAGRAVTILGLALL
jgi:hypothetical protein